MQPVMAQANEGIRSDCIDLVTKSADTSPARQSTHSQDLEPTHAQNNEIKSIEHEYTAQGESFEALRMRTHIQNSQAQRKNRTSQGTRKSAAAAL